MQGKIFWILNKRAGGNFLFKRLINVQDCQYNILPHPRVEVQMVQGQRSKFSCQRTVVQTPKPSVHFVALSMVWQFAVWYQHTTQRTRGRFPIMVIHHTHTSSLPSNIFHQIVPKGVPSSRLERHLPTSTPNIASFDHLAHYRPSNQRGSIKGPTKTPPNPI